MLVVAEEHIDPAKSLFVQAWLEHFRDAVNNQKLRHGGQQGDER
jgi:hypothetical protein